MAHPTELSLPCEICGSATAADTDELGLHNLLDAWLDGKVTFRCVIHRARNEP